MAQQPYVQFHDGQAYPQFGLGTWRMDDAVARSAVRTAIEQGYRHFDTAAVYGNERGVGEGIRDSGIPREQVCVTTKVDNPRQGYDETLRAVEDSLAKLGIGPVDLLLIHWPCPRQDLYVDTWKAMIRLRREGRVRSIGVSNFMVEHLERLIGETGEVPVVNQLELHPEFQQRDVRDFHEDNSIIIQSWSPLGQGKASEHPVFAEIGEKYGKTGVQVVLRWHLEQGLVVFPKSENPDRIASNFDVFDFSLSEDDLARIDALDMEDGRIGPDPLTFPRPSRVPAWVRRLSGR